jgi:hypothetical protein
MRRFAVVTMAVALSALVPALAVAQSITPVEVFPTTVPVGVGTLVRVTAGISDPGVIPSSVVLQRIDAAGRVVGTLGPMLDDGGGGDLLAGDKIFTARPNFFETAAGTVRLRVSAAFQGRLQRVVSAPVSLVVSGAGATVSITQPSNLAYLSVSPTQVRGTVGDQNASVVINGVTATVNSDKTFTALVPLLEGANTLTAVATNSNLAVATASVQATLDTTPPHVNIDTPETAFTTSASSISVAGLVNDIVVGTVNTQQATVKVNGLTAAVSNRSSLAVNVPLSLGDNPIQAVATDRSGNSATASVLVKRVAVAGGAITVTGGNNQTAPAGQVLGKPLVVKLTNDDKTPAANQPVVFRVVENSGGLVSGSARLGTLAVNTDAQGQASAQLQVGLRSGVGNNVVEATATGFDGTAVFTASGTPTAATQIVVDTGNGQTGVVGQPLPLPFIGIVTDAGFNRLAGVPVTFTVKQGGGTINGKPSYTTTSDGDGRIAAVLALGLQEGFDNNVVEATFAGNTGQPAAFLASAKVPGDPGLTSITGVVLDNSNQPIEGVTLRLFRTHHGTGLPEEVVVPVETEEGGTFEIKPAPVGAFKLMADGSTAPAGPWPTLEFDIVTVAGQVNDVGLPIYLPKLDDTNALCVTATTGGTLTLPQVPGFALTIAPGSATFPGGSKIGCVTVTPVNADKVPMSPGFGQQPRFVVTIQPVGTIFNPPAAITLPNVDGLAPRAVTEMYSYDHDLAAFVAIGTGTVSEDGSVIASDPGVGVIKAGWHCGGNPNTVGSAGSCPECQKCEGTNCVPNNGGACNDKDSCTKDDKCVNGSCKGTPIDLSSWTDDLTLAADVKLPSNILDKINNVFSYIPGLSGIKFKEARVGVQGRAKNCCEADGGIQEMGLKEAAGTFALTAQVANIPIWGTPTISREIDFVVAIVSVDFQLGLVFTSNFRINASAGIRQSACDDENDCGFGEANVSLDPELKTTFEAIACLETLWTSKVCGGITITPFALRANFSGALTYNKPSCSDGFSGNITIGKVTARAEFALDVPGGPQRVVIQYVVFDGIVF